MIYRKEQNDDGLSSFSLQYIQNAATYMRSECTKLSPSARKSTFLHVIQDYRNRHVIVGFMLRILSTLYLGTVQTLQALIKKNKTPQPPFLQILDMVLLIYVLDICSSTINKI